MWLAPLLALLAGGTLVQARVPDSPWVVALELPDWKAELAKPKPIQYSDVVYVLGGEIQGGSTLAVLRQMSNITWEAHRLRRLESEIQTGGPFECEGFPCVDRTVRIKQEVLGYVEAYLSAGDQYFELSFVRPNRSLPRADLARIVKSFRILLLRRGAIEDYPKDLVEGMTRRALTGPALEAWKKRILLPHAQPWIAAFVEAEFGRYEKQPAQQQIQLYATALELFAKEEQPSPQLRFACAMAREGLGLAQIEAKLLTDAIASLEGTRTWLLELKRPEAIDLAYDLARAHALAAHTDEALASLALAIAGNDNYIDSAAREHAFVLLRKLPAFLELIRAKPSDSGNSGR